MTFRSAIRLESVSDRTHSLIDTLNSTSVAGYALMVVLDASPVSDSKEILGKIQFSVDDLKVTFGVITPNIDELMLFASRFNMASAMHCTIRYSIKGESLYLIYKPPNEKLEEVLRDFFELTEKSNWIVILYDSVWQHIHHRFPLGFGGNKPQKKKYFLRSISFWFYYYSADSEVSSVSGAS